MPRNNYQRLENNIITNCCDHCLTKYEIYNFKWNKVPVKCILNDARGVVLYPKNSNFVRFNYKNIKRIEMRPCMKLILVLDDSEVVLKGFRRKTAFYKLRDYFQRQLLTQEITF